MSGEINYLYRSLLFFRIGAFFLDKQVPSSVSITGKFFSYLFIFLLESYIKKVSVSERSQK